MEAEDWKHRQLDLLGERLLKLCWMPSQYATHGSMTFSIATVSRLLKIDKRLQCMIWWLVENLCHDTRPGKHSATGDSRLRVIRDV